MSSKTKIVVLKMKEIIYTGIFLGLGVLLITLFLIMFRSEKNAAETSAPADTMDNISYIPGIYSSSLVLGSQSVHLEVAVDSNQITSIRYTPIGESIETMYPLMAPAAASMIQQITETQSLENLSYPEGGYYTSLALVNCVKNALEKASVTP